MKKIHTEVKHSESKDAWNVIGTTMGEKFKIARVPYFLCNNVIIDTRNKAEALEHAQFICACFNNHAQGFTSMPVWF